MGAGSWPAGRFSVSQTDSAPWSLSVINQKLWYFQFVLRLFKDTSFKKVPSSLKVFPKLKLADMSRDNGSPGSIVEQIFMKELTLSEVLFGVFPSDGL
jgi:hypothetical protein